MKTPIIRSKEKFRSHSYAEEDGAVAEPERDPAGAAAHCVNSPSRSLSEPFWAGAAPPYPAMHHPLPSPDWKGRGGGAEEHVGRRRDRQASVPFLFHWEQQQQSVGRRKLVLCTNHLPEATVPASLMEGPALIFGSWPP